MRGSLPHERGRLEEVRTPLAGDEARVCGPASRTHPLPPGNAEQGVLPIETLAGRPQRACPAQDTRCSLPWECGTVLEMTVRPV